MRPNSAAKSCGQTSKIPYSSFKCFEKEQKAVRGRILDPMGSTSVGVQSSIFAIKKNEFLFN